MNHVRLARLLALAAGLLDSGSGLGFAFFPTQTLTLMRTSVAAEEALVYVRFVGAFVAAVGVSYLWALFRGDLNRLRGVLEFTLIFRLATGVFATAAIARGWLTPTWASVPTADFALIGIQLWLLTKLPTHDVPSSSPSSY
jgi:hypothetical protein